MSTVKVMASPYAHDATTPIASAKRPRMSHLQNDGMSPVDSRELDQDSYLPTPPNIGTSPEDLNTPDRLTQPETGSSSDFRDRMSSFFSPVLRFLGGKDDDGKSPASSDLGEERFAEHLSSPMSTASPRSKSRREYDARNGLSGGVRTSPSESSDNTSESTADEDALEFNTYLFMKQLPPYHSVNEPNKICLPPRSPELQDKMTLVLDLDETLVHCTIDEVPNPDHIFPVQFNGFYYQVYVRLRPHLQHFLRAVSQMFEVVVFTASQKVYADALLDIIDPKHELVRHRLFREACLCVEGNYLKDLNVLGRDLKRTVLVDNSPHAFGYQVDNGIPIESWYESDADNELLRLLGFLQRLQKEDDVRALVRDEFDTQRLISEAGRR
uniref:FCP1 homology domain-containing protein n=1 Tax=Pinguiococcus pyrenoidosus TaxID=172671 RepID=A0A7R9U6B2_9STRA|mmetsp:Transcript_15839/g.60324  ORF Transcript_15839/g.60324 Transcript_15839/m.60324 type:complete len:383 (+) Transcript_15839:584-1732(+)